MIQEHQRDCFNGAALDDDKAYIPAEEVTAQLDRNADAFMTAPVVGHPHIVNDTASDPPTISVRELEEIVIGDRKTKHPFIISANWKATGKPLTNDELDLVDEEGICALAAEQLQGEF